VPLPTPAAGVPAIPELGFAVRDAGVLERAAVPTLRLGLAVDAQGADVRSVVLDVQVQIAARRRSYQRADPDRLFELFGAPAQWGTTLRTLPWTRTTVVVPPFRGTTEVDLHVPCTYDFEVLTARYLDALPDGDIPLELMFSGAVFYVEDSGRLQTARIGWDREAEFRLPVAVWRETMWHYFPQTGWLRLDRERLERLSAYKSRHALPSLDAAIDALLEGRE